MLNRALSWSAQSTVTGVTDSVNPSASQSFSYDAVDRLLSAAGQYGNLAYTYDSNGNRTSRTDGAGTVNYTYSTNTDKLATVGAMTITRDGAGNRTADGTFRYDYSLGGNRLVTVKTYAYPYTPVGTYEHNGLGERVKKTVGGVTTLFVYDLSGKLIGEYDGTGALIREHAYGPSGRLASFDAAGNTYWHHNDHLGTPQALTNAAGTVVWTMSQTPFGIATVNEDPDGDGTNVTNNFRFPGQYYDAESGLYYNMNRDYDPALGRYPQSDPIGLRGGLNTFAYVGGNPISFIDPLGLFGLTYDNNAGTLTIVDSNGNVVGTYPASNNAQRSSRGPWQSGTYNYDYHTSHPDDAPDSAYGSNGNFVFEVPGCVGCGVHSGRENRTDRAGRSGPQYATNGCIRTTDEATSEIQRLIQGGDFLQTLTVIR